MLEGGEFIGTTRVQGIGQRLTGEDEFDDDGGRPAPEKKRLIFLLASSL